MEFSKPVPKYQLQGGSSGGAGDAVAPMPGVIEKVFLSNRVFEIQLNFEVMVEEGAAVAAGDPLMVMIAMKMEYVIKGMLSPSNFQCWSKEHGHGSAQLLKSKIQLPNSRTNCTNNVQAPAAGTVSRVAGKVGDFVEKNKVSVPSSSY